MIPDRAKLTTLADLLDDDAVFDFVAGSIIDSRDLAPRAPGDRDTGEVLEELIGRLRDVARAA